MADGSGGRPVQSIEEAIEVTKQWLKDNNIEPPPPLEDEVVFKDGELPVSDAGEWSRADDEIDHDPLLRDVAFNKHSRNFAPNGANIVSPLAQAGNEVGTDGIQVSLVQGLPIERDVAKVIWKGKNATRGVDISDVALMEREIGEDPESWREMFRGGLQTAMEAFVIVFEISGVSRTCTHQLVRSRRAGFHQQSQRAGSYTQPSGIVKGAHVDHDKSGSLMGLLDKYPNALGEGMGPNVRIPESLWRAMGATTDFRWGTDGKKGSGRDAELQHAVQASLMWARKAYRLALESDVSYQDARYLLPEGTTNYIMCEYTLREFLNVYAYRACSMFSWEIVHVVREMGALLLEQSPWLAGTAGEPRISCEVTRGPAEFGGHTCTFQGWERVEEQCDFPWAKEENRAFKPKDSI
jgi:thymidylate synthase ThyX